MAGYTDPQSIHNPTNGLAISAAWGDIVRDNDEWLSGGASNPKPSCRIFNSAILVIPNATNTALAFDSERWDKGAMHSVSVNTSRITVPANGAGKYMVSGHVAFAAHATGVRAVWIMLNNATRFAMQSAPATSATDQTFSISTIMDLSVADYVELFVFQSAGVALNVNQADAYTPEFTAMWLSI